MDDNKNQNQPKTADYQKILDEYATSVKKEEEFKPEEKELTSQEKPIENVPLKEADPEPSIPVEPVIPELTHTLTDDLEEEMTKTLPVPEDKPATAELKSINSPQLEAPIHPSLAANLEDEDDAEIQPQPPVITPKPEVEFTSEPTPQEEKPLTPQPETSLPENQEIPQVQKSPEEVKAEIEKILSDDDSKNNSEPTEAPVVTKKSSSPKTFFIFALVLFFLVIAAMAYFLFLAPANTSSSSSTATPTTIPTTSVVNDGSCDLNGSTYNVGESFDSADGCNTCNCVSAGVITCTEMACSITPSAAATKSATTTSTTKTDFQKMITNFTLYKDISSIKRTDFSGTGDWMGNVKSTDTLYPFVQKMLKGSFKELIINKSNLNTIFGEYSYSFYITPNYENWSNEKFQSDFIPEYAHSGIGELSPLYAYSDKLVWSSSLNCGGARSDVVAEQEAQDQCELLIKEIQTAFP